jgi:hypothetical protein
MAFLLCKKQVLPITNIGNTCFKGLSFIVWKEVETAAKNAEWFGANQSVLNSYYNSLQLQAEQLFM